MKDHPSRNKEGINVRVYEKFKEFEEFYDFMTCTVGQKIRINMVGSAARKSLMDDAYTGIVAAVDADAYEVRVWFVGGTEALEIEDDDIENVQIIARTIDHSLSLL